MDEFERLIPHITTYLDGSCSQRIIWKLKEDKRRKNEFFLLLKPETLDHESARSESLKTLSRLFSDKKLSFHAVCAQCPPCAQRLTFSDRNYPILNAISRGGKRYLHDSALKSLANLTDGLDISVLGGDQALASGLIGDERALDALTVAKGTTKLGSGIYATRYQAALLLNAFYPLQRIHLSQGPLLGVFGSTDAKWSDLRKHIIGGIHPQNAPIGSLRRELYNLGRGVTNISRNGVHISPGPLEALWQFENFWGEKWPISKVQLKWEEMGLEINELWELSRQVLNPPLFEATENCETEEAIAIAHRLAVSKKHRGHLQFW